MRKANLEIRDLDLLREMGERELLERFTESAEVRLFNEFKTGDVETRRHTGYKLDALAALSKEIQSAINEAIRNVGRSDRPSDRSAAG